MDFFLLFVLLLRIGWASSIEVAPSSPCAGVCLDQPGTDPSNPQSSSTTAQDLICNDFDYERTANGQKTKACLSCELNSTYFDTAHKEGESDLMWLLFNTKFTISWCLFGFPNNRNVSSTSCTNPCAPLRSAITTNITNIGISSEYDYCSSQGPAPFQDAMNQCATCLAYSDGQHILGKSCDQKPNIGSKLSLSANLFDTSLESSQSLISQGASTNTTVTNHATPKSLNTTTSIIIGLISGFVITGALLGLFFVARRARRRRLGDIGSPQVDRKDSKSDYSRSLESRDKWIGPKPNNFIATRKLMEIPADPVGNIPEMQAAGSNNMELGITVFPRQSPYQSQQAYQPYRPEETVRPIRITPQPVREIHLPPGGLPHHPRGHPSPTPEIPTPPKDRHGPPQAPQRIPKRKPVPLNGESLRGIPPTYRSMVSPVV